jgi:hypothetical protein
MNGVGAIRTIGLVVAVGTGMALAGCIEDNTDKPIPVPGSRGITQEELWRPLVGSTLADPYEWCLRHSYGPATQGPPKRGFTASVGS